MRSFIYCLATVVAVSGSAVNSAHAESTNENRAQQIAGSLKESGQLKDYRVGVKFEDGIAWLTGTVTSSQQRQVAEQVARSSPGVNHVVNKLEVENTEALAIEDQNFEVASNSPQRQEASRAGRSRSGTPRQRRAAPKRSNNMPVPYARAGGGRRAQPATQNRQASYHPGGMPSSGPMGGPMPQGGGMPGATGQPASYDNPQMPGYAWPTYAAQSNYAALTYPKQYSPSAWPYIGPFYPYPQVPLGWRKVTLEWDDGWWFLDFKDNK